MGNQQLTAAAAGLIPHQSLLSTLKVSVWRVPHPYQEEAGENEEEEEGREEVVIVLR